MSHDVAALAPEWFERVWNRCDKKRLHETIHPMCFGTLEGGSIKKANAFIEKRYRPFLGAFPDLHIEVITIIANENEAFVRWRAVGTCRADTLGVEPFGDQATFRGITWQRYQDGKLIEGQDSWNQNALFEALSTRSSVSRVDLTKKH